MPDTTILALVAGAAVVALVAIIASRRRRRRQLADEIGELPAYLYLASHTPENTPRNGTTPPNGGRLTAGTQPNGGRLTAGTQPNGGPAAGGGGLQTNGAPGT